MNCTIERALVDAKVLIERLGDYDSAAESQSAHTHRNISLRLLVSASETLGLHCCRTLENESNTGSDKCNGSRMRRALEVDERLGCGKHECISQLDQENKGLREILQITQVSFWDLRRNDAPEGTSSVYKEFVESTSFKYVDCGTVW
uniref:Uncharacterized protein n=1 Tax=Equus caballus TaxID=9796 RepID=A0A9L0SKX1_HORSE